MDTWLSGWLCGYLMLLLWFYCDCRWIHDYQDACVDTSCCYCDFTVIVDGYMTIRMHVCGYLMLLLWFYCDFTVIVDGFMTIRIPVWIPHVVTVILLWFYCDCRWIHDYQDACVDKLEQFLHGEMNSRCSSGSRPPLTKANSLGTTTELHGMHSLRPANPVSSAAKTPDTAWAELSGGGGLLFSFYSTGNYFYDLFLYKYTDFLNWYYFLFWSIVLYS